MFLYIYVLRFKAILNVVHINQAVVILNAIDCVIYISEYTREMFNMFKAYNR